MSIVSKMKSFVFSLLLSICYVESATFYAREDETPEQPLNLKVTKLLDFKVGSQANQWKNELTRLLQSQIEDNDLEKAEKSNVKVTFAVDKSNVENLRDKHVQDYLDFKEGCKYLVGTSKVPPCNFNTITEKTESKKYIPRSCLEIKENGNNVSGVYEIQPRTSVKPFMVLCDMETKGGGWTHIQKRFDGSQDFLLGWRYYKFGFGDLNGEFWIGLENIHHMIGFEQNELLVELTDRDKKKAYAQYQSFAIGPEKEGYTLTVLKGYSGDAGDALTHHLNSKFSTIDVDQDENAGSCATVYMGAWWYKNCHMSNLNGKMVNIDLKDAAYANRGINWSGFKPREYFLAGSRMLVRPYQE